MIKNKDDSQEQIEYLEKATDLFSVILKNNLPPLLPDMKGIK